MSNSHDLSSRPSALRRLCDFAASAGAATIVVCLLLLLLTETARRGSPRPYFAMSDSNSLGLLIRRLPWLFIETPGRAAGFLSVVLLVAILALRIELGQSWNLYAAGRQVAKAGEDYQLLLQAVGSAFEGTDGELVVFVGDRPSAN